MRMVSILRFGVFVVVLSSITRAQTPQIPSNPAPDDRYKADILLIVAHPDDDTEIGPYLAKAIYDDHKRVAVIYGTRGDSGPNFVGNEQAATLGDVREIEGRRAMASLGVMNVWFLRGPDTPGQDVLHSLETWHHGTALEQIVRLVRLTRPEVILTWLPDYVVGENHDDHQASGVIATEAFDMSGDPLVFPEQVAMPRDHTSISNYGEGLRPWQPKKIYYFSDATHFDFFEGHGPSYSSAPVSPSKGLPYSKIAEGAWRYYNSQNDMPPEHVPEFQAQPSRFIFGKSLVKGTPTGDLFDGIAPGRIPFTPGRAYEPAARAEVWLELGGPWAFYRAFWHAHNIDSLSNLFSPEAGVGPGETLWVPLVIHNDTDSTKQVTVRSTVPAGWTERSAPAVYSVAPHDSYSVQMTLVPPEAQKNTWQKLSWSAEADGKTIEPVILRVNVVSNGLPQ